ncbi:hypothetical protein Dip510_001265 [Elusimicrobium posterum]
MTEKTNTGTYVYDAKLKKVVKVSADIPKVAKQQPGCPNAHICGAGCSHK